MKIILLACLAPAAILHGQLVDCRTSDAGYKVYLDDVAYSGPKTLRMPDAKDFMNRLRFRLKNGMEQMKAETRLPLTVVRCEGRQPGDENDFNLRLVDALNSRDVLLEVWGSIIPGAGRPFEALIGFALIPVRFYERGSSDIPGVYAVRYLIRSKLDDAAELLGDALELRAFVSLAAGIKAHKQKKYNEAYDCLCDGAALVARFQAEGTTAAKPSLISYARRLALETVRAANADPAYQGRLTLVNAAQPSQICPARRKP
ncbi:MAG TPA: hypothetical protein VMZ52_13285 [Bryobacteraceae bacterium]|nr:hypothetical protein [Bryobacteraceae bacterium]